MSRGGKLALSCALGLVLLLLAEAAARHVPGIAHLPVDASAREYFGVLGVHESDRPLPPRLLPPKTGFRFVLAGDSTAVGFPFGEDLSFGAFLAAGLSAVDARPRDVVPVAIAGRSSAGVRADLEAVFAAEPDLLLLYIGHNEYAHRISRPSPFGPVRHGVLARWLPGLSDLARALRSRSATAGAATTGSEAPMFPSELGHAARLLTHGDPEGLPSAELPLAERERTLHRERYEENVRAILAEASARGVRTVVIEPVSSLLAAPLASGRLFDGRARDAWERGRALTGSDPAAARAALVEARDLDPAPIRLSTEGLAALRRAAGEAPRVALDDGGLERRFVDMVHPHPELAALFAERIAESIPFEDAPRLAPDDGEARARFRLACARRIEARSDAVREGVLAGALLAAHLYLEYGHRAAAEEVVRAVPEKDRTFGLVILLDLALRWRGETAEADAALRSIERLHSDWSAPLAWWRARLAAAGR